MKSLHIRDIDETVLERLRVLEQLHHRSVQGEVRAILEEAAERAPDAEAYRPLDLVTVATGRDDSWSRKDLYGDDAR